MSKPRMFIGSSVEGLNVAYAVQQNLLHDAEVTVWDQGVFELSKTTIESLSKALQESDFAVFVFSPDDLVKIRSTTSSAIRDNVLFEFGLFIGKLGRERVYFLTPMAGDLHLPSDLLGITPGKYEENRSDGSMQAATGAACNQIRTQMRALGYAPGRLASTVNLESSEPNTKRSWFHDFFENKYLEARTSLLEEHTKQKGDEALSTQAWILICDYHISGETDIGPITTFAVEHIDKPSIQALTADLLRFENRTSAAMTILTNAQIKNPKSPAIIQAIARCHSDVEDNESAIAELQRFGPEHYPDVAIDLAEAFELDSRLSEAMQIIQKCLMNHPTNTQLRYKYARLAQDMNQHEIAVALLWSLSIDNPKSIEYLGYLGNSCLQLEFFDQALHAYRKAEALMAPDSTSQWIVANIGNLLNNQGLPSEAIKYFERAIKNEPMSEYSHDRMAGALKKKSAEEKRFEKARANGRRQIKEAELKLHAHSPEIPSAAPNLLASIPNNATE
jgi:tetratricopeptide (TPR) repeat protein